MRIFGALEVDGLACLAVRKPRPDEAARQKDRWIGQFIFSTCLNQGSQMTYFRGYIILGKIG